MVKTQICLETQLSGKEVQEAFYRGTFQDGYIFMIRSSHSFFVNFTEIGMLWQVPLGSDHGMFIGNLFSISHRGRRSSL